MYHFNYCELLFSDTPTSRVHGAILDGIFQGTVQLSPTLNYHIVPSRSVLNQSTSFPSVIYADKDYRW